MEIETLDDNDALLDLARRAGDGGVLSVYVNADPYAEPNPEGNAIDVRNRFRELQQRLRGDSPGLLPHLEALEPIISDLTRADAPGRGRVLFAALPDGWRMTLASQMPVANRVVLDDGPFIHPLLELLDEGRRAGLLIFSGEQAWLHEWRLGRLRLLSTLEREVIEHPHERAGQLGGGPPGRFDNPVREQRKGRERDRAARFLDDVIAATAELAAERRWERVLVSGGPRWTDPVAGALDPLFGDRVIRDARVLGGLGDAELAETVTDTLRRVHSESEARLLERLGEHGYRATAIGLSDVVGALNTGRVAHLVYDPQVRYTGYVDPRGLLFGGEEVPPHVPDAVPDSRFTERMVERALETGARISPVEGATAGALQGAQGTAALLRW